MKQIFSILVVILSLSCSQKSNEQEKFYAQLNDSTKRAFQIASKSLDSFLEKNFDGGNSYERIISMCNEIESITSVSELNWKIDNQIASQISNLVSLKDSSLYPSLSIYSRIHGSQYVNGLVECCARDKLASDYLEAISSASNISTQTLAGGILVGIEKSREYSIPLRLIVIYEFYIPYLIQHAQTLPNNT